ncbi:unnamed protein product [Rotaria magnacalcarata]|uniref:DDE-1 domain-containing protein n=2 Tax=Rotaria magnacalcarata TaxID=392030 RepID=A0A8S2K2L5_9BILA|nr:unnamed protein product [Rotaria magnacalcarata]
MDTKDSFDIFISKNFVRFSGKENAFEWLDETESKFNEFRMVRSLRFRAIPMLIEGDIELKYFRVREYIRTFDDFYVFLLSLYDLEFSTSSEGQFFLKLLDNQFDNPSNGKVQCSDEHDYCQIKSIDYFCESLSSEFETNCSFPSEQKFLTIVTENISNEEFLIPTTLTDNVMERCLDSFDNISSEKETNETCSSITVAFGATNTIGEIPVKKLLMTTTDYSFVVIDQVLNDLCETTSKDNTISYSNSTSKVETKSSNQSANTFVLETDKSIENYNSTEVLNTSKASINLELVGNRTLTHMGEQSTWFSVRSTSNTTHSCTIQSTKALNGTVFGPLYLSKNIVLACSKNDKLTHSLVTYWRDHCLVPNLSSKALLLVDSFPSHANPEVDKDLKNFEYRVIPPKTTSFIQPLDIYYNRQYKMIPRRVYDHVRVGEIDINLAERNNIIKLQPLVHS